MEEMTLGLDGSHSAEKYLCHQGGLEMEPTAREAEEMEASEQLAAVNEGGR